MKRIATALAALLLAAGISWGQDPDLTGFLEQLENVNGRMATAMNNDDSLLSKLSSSGITVIPFTL